MSKATPYFKITQIAERYGVTRQAVYKWLRLGKLGKPAEDMLHLVKAGHHQVGQLIDHQHHVGHPVRPGAVLVKSLNVACPGGGQLLVTLVHLGAEPAQRAQRLTR